MPSEEELFKIVNRNSEILDVSAYIIKKYNIILMDEAKEFARYLLKEKKFTKKEILSGKADILILKLFQSVAIKRNTFNSVPQDNEEQKEIQLKTVKKYIPTEVLTKRILKFLGATLLLTFMAMGIKDVYDDIKLEASVSQCIGMLASDNKYKMSIVSQNRYQIPGTYDSQNNPTIAYYNDRIAADIIKVCSNDPDLFDICMQDTYFNMDINRLKNMDEVLKWLKIFSQNDSNLSYIYEQIQDCDVFLEYLVKEGYISPNDEMYRLVIEDIEKYKLLKDDYSVPFLELPKESQARIESLLISEYEKNKDISYPLYVEKLEQLVAAERTGGGRSGS